MKKAHAGRTAIVGLGLILAVGVAGLSLAQSSRERLSGGGSGSSSVLAAGATGTGLTLTPGPLAVGASGISTDGGLIVTYYDGNGNGITLLHGSVWVTDGSGVYLNSAGTQHLYHDGTTPAVNAGFTVNGIMTVVGAAGAGDLVVGGNATITGAIHSASTKSVGIITIGGGGTGTATVATGAICVCSYSTVGVIIPLCNVSGTTLTATGTVAANMAYVCL